MVPGQEAGTTRYQQAFPAASKGYILVCASSDTALWGLVGGRYWVTALSVFLTMDRVQKAFANCCSGGSLQRTLVASSCATEPLFLFLGGIALWSG